MTFIRIAFRKSSHVIKKVRFNKIKKYAWYYITFKEKNVENHMFEDMLWTSIVLPSVLGLGWFSGLGFLLNLKAIRAAKGHLNTTWSCMMILLLNPIWFLVRFELETANNSNVYGTMARADRTVARMGILSTEFETEFMVECCLMCWFDSSTGKNRDWNCFITKQCFKYFQWMMEEIVEYNFENKIYQ